MFLYIRLHHCKIQLYLSTKFIDFFIPSHSAEPVTFPAVADGVIERIQENIQIDPSFLMGLLF